MSATLAPSARPINPLTMWADHLNIYVELPGAMPCIMRFPISEAGLWKALTMLRNQRYDFGGTPMQARRLDPRIAAAQAILNRR
jgi:hypothetical protein